MMPFRGPALAVLVALAAIPAAAQNQPKAVVELFTSQGCASCPPADALLSELAKDPQIITLTLAVDYWDYIGWKDTLALHGHSLRQKAYAERRADRKIFTPQMVVGGTVAVKGSDRAAVQRAILATRAGGSAQAVPLTVRKVGDELEVELPDAKLGPDGAELWACPVEGTATVAIGRGENTGRNMTYSNVVRGWFKIATWHGAAGLHRVAIKDLRREGADQVTVLLQSGSASAPGPILGAATIPLE